MLVLFIGILVTLGIFMLRYLDQCPHKWEVKERYSNDNNTSLIKECKYCHKLKKEVLRN